MHFIGEPKGPISAVSYASPIVEGDSSGNTEDGLDPGSPGCNR
jgi:hypothetical protein